MSLIVTPVVAHLSANRAALGIKDVAGVGDLITAMDGLVASPSLFVVRGGGAARTSSTGTGYITQDATIAFDVISGFTRASLKGALDAVDEVAAAIEQLLVGWPHPAGEPCELRSDGIARLDLQKGLLFFRQSFVSTRTIRSIA